MATKQGSRRGKFLRRSDLKEHADRFWAKVLKGAGAEACWLWRSGSKIGTVPSFMLDRDEVGRCRNVKITRVAYALAHGRVSDKEIVKQTCADARCVRHLKAVPYWEITAAAVAAQKRPSRARYVEAFMKKVRKLRNGCWIWQGAYVGGYGLFWYGRNMGAHVASVILFQRKEPGRRVVRHYKCANSSCVNPKHLKLGTHSENAHDTVRDRARRGENVNTAILTEHEVAQIRGRYVKFPGAQSALAHAFGVTPQVIWNIVVGKTWKHVKAAKGLKRLTAEECRIALRYARGSRHVNSKLTDKKVREMRKAFASGVSAETLATKYSLKHPQTYAILAGRAWTHVVALTPEAQS